MPESRNRILFVEDSGLLRDAVVGVLAEKGFAVTTAATAQAACNLIDNQVFDVLVVDIYLETRRDGLNVASHWRARLPGAPVIFTTAYPRAAVDVGPLGPRDGFLMKPYRVSELLIVLRFAQRPGLAT